MNLNPTVEMLIAKGMQVPAVRYEEEIRRFQESDKVNPIPPNGILFVGDSDIRHWTFNNQFDLDFKGLPVLNRGFGGARTWEVLLYFNELIMASQPSVIVYCCGDNDIAKLGEGGAKNAVLGFQLFVEMVKKNAPSVKKVLYLEIHFSPIDEPLWCYISRANEQLEELCNNDPILDFVKYGFLLEDETGKLDLENFKEDQYHFSPKFYHRFADFLKPKLKNATQ